MPINNITQIISTIPEAGRRGDDVQTQFVTKQEDFQDHLQGITVGELNALKTDLNLRIGEINSTTTTMNGYASTASSGASTATTKAGEASTSASGALTSKNQASTFATNASTSATKASQWADNAYNVAVETGKYSAKHWSTVAQNASANKVDKVTSTDNAIVRFNGTTGDVQNSGIRIDDAGNILIGKPSGGVTTVSMANGAGNTNLVLPESGVVATEAYVDSKTWRDINYKSTPVSIISWSYSGTTITLNVTSHTFVVGDYIEVSGLTSTTNAPNGVFLVTSVTTGTIVFTAYATPTGTAGVSTAKVKGFTTLNGKIISEDIGINQSWQSVTRLSNTNYVSPTNRMIRIAFYGNSSAATAQINLTITPIGSTTAIAIPIGTTASSAYGGFNFSIPAGCTYKIAPLSGTFTVLTWYEFR